MSSKNGFDQAIGPTRMIMSAEGIYPDPFLKRIGLHRIQFILTVWVILFYCNISQSIKVFEVWGDLNEVIEILTTMDLPIIVALIKIVGLRWNGDALRPVILTMMNDWKTLKAKEELDVMWKNAKLSRLGSITMISLGGSTCVMKTVTQILLERNGRKNWAALETNTTDVYERQLFFKAEFYYNTQMTPLFEITWFLQCMSMFSSGLAYAAIDAFFAVLVLHLCGRLSIVRNNIKKLPASLTAEWNGEPYDKILAKIVEDHIFLESYAKSIEDAFNLQFLAQMVICTVVICLQGYEIVTIATSGEGLSLFELIYMSYFIMSFMFSIFLYCFVAERLREECEEIGEAAFDVDWYNFPKRNAIPLTMIMLRAKKPFPITAGKFVEFSLELYATILKTSGGYLSMLLAVRDRLE